jgi:hypothetical protein
MGTPMTTYPARAKLPARAFALAATASVAFGGIAYADPTHERANCETQAKSSFQDLTQEYVSVLLNVKVRFEIIANDYQAAFSEKVNSCLLLVHKTASIDRKVSDTSYLIDAASRTMYALYVETNGNVASCLLIPTVKETKPCRNRREFEDFVGNYLK